MRSWVSELGFGRVGANSDRRSHGNDVPIAESIQIFIYLFIIGNKHVC